MIFEGTEHEMADEDWIAAPVKKGRYLNCCTSSLFDLLNFYLGSVVLIHGRVMHKSEENKSNNSRHGM